MKFYDWIIQFKGEDSIYGDIATDVLRDKTFPKDVTSIKDLEVHLINKRADEDVIKEVKSAWKEFKAEKKS